MERWRRDPGVSELLAHLDRPEVYGNFGALTKSDLRQIASELEKCHNSFEYAARNYFWIVTKETGDMLFNLWPVQEMILEQLYELKAKHQPQKVYIIKARQLGCSTLAEALLAWKSIYSANTRGLLVSVDEPHASDLFSKILHILDKLPWWMQPMTATREYKEGIWFCNPNEKMRASPDTAGLNSKITVQHSTQYAGIGQGITIQGCHVSEIADWMEDTARRAVEGDLVYALANNEDTIGIIETTGHGAGSYAESLWLSNMDLGDFAEWRPIFIPWFFEKKRVLAPPKGWKPDAKSVSLAGRVADEWVICPQCGTVRESNYGGSSLVNQVCSKCDRGHFNSYKLTNEQLCWYHKEWINRERKKDGGASLKTLKEEMATTAQESFQLSGTQIFDEDCQEWVNTCIRKPVVTGYLDERGYFHGVRENASQKHECVQEWCGVDHTFDVHKPVQIWEWPKANEEYVIGVDVAEGIGQDYSVAFVNRKGRGQNSDVQVAMLRSNQIDAMEFAKPVVQLGYMYNEAMLSIEYNYPTCADTVRIQYQYPNLYRWVHEDANRIFSNKWHWKTQSNNKPKLWQTGRRWLRGRQWVIRSETFLYEMKRFQKIGTEDKKAGAAPSFHDDVILAGLISLYTGHNLDSDEALTASIRPPTNADNAQTADWLLTCLICNSTWGSSTPDKQLCPNCNSFMVKGKANSVPGLKKELDWNELAPAVYAEGDEKEYDVL